MLHKPDVRPTRMGILLLDSLDEPQRSIEGNYDRLFAKLFGSTEHTELVPFDGRGELPEHTACDGWIIPGSRSSVYDEEPWIRELERWTFEALDQRVPLAGICFGHQMIGRVLGAPVAKAPIGWNIGAIDYDVHSQPAHVSHAPERFRLLASHQDQVLELPSGATLFASSERCPIAGYSIDDNVLCVQGHPEFSPALAASLYRARADRIGARHVEAALQTIDRPLDRTMVAGWLAQTIRHRSRAELI